MEYCVLLHHLFRSGINGKVNGTVSSAIKLHRGVRQGSVLSPLLFLLVMDPLLRNLAKANAGIAINDIYAGYFATLMTEGVSPLPWHLLKSRLVLLNV